MARNYEDGQNTGARVLVPLEAGQSFTGTWENMGPRLETIKAKQIVLWVCLDINDSKNARVRLTAYQTPTSTVEFLMPIKVISSKVVYIEAEYYEFNKDIDQCIILILPLYGCVPQVQFQIMAETVGAIPAKMACAEYSLTRA